jgi:tetratricopeptide (TPR) repeat protein
MAEQDMVGLDEALEAIDELVEEGDFEGALRRLDEAVEAFGPNPQLLVLRAEIALEDEDYDECLVAATDGLGRVEEGQDKARLLAIKGYAHFYLDQIEEARLAFNEAVRFDSELYMAVIGRAIVHEHKGHYRAAMLDVERAIALDADEAQPFGIRASILLRSGALAEAEADFKAALERDEAEEEARLQLARLQAVAGRKDEAMETLEALVEEGEDEEFVAPGALLRSQLSLTLGSTEAAAEDAQKAIDLTPDEPWGYLQLAACHLTAMNADKALEALKQAASKVDDERDLPDLFALRAAAYDQLEKFDKARKLREEAEGWARLPGVVYGEFLNPARNIPINPNKPVDVRALLGELFGDPASAPAGYEKAIRDVLARIPDIVAQNPGIGRIQIELPQVAGMQGPPRTLVLQVNQPQGAPAPEAQQ